MIVQPNFLDHWKTRLLQTELGDDPLAPTYVLRLWGHCQEQKSHRFTRLSAGALAAICHFKGAPEQLWLAMQTAQFIFVKGERVEAHQWNDYNSGLITSWENGKKGGRPKKPTGYPRVAHGQPEANPKLTDRGDRIEEMGLDGILPAAEPQGQGKQRPRNLVMDELAILAGIPLAEIGADVAKRLNRVITTIKQSTPDVTPEEIRRRANNYTTHFQDAKRTPEALAKHWGTCSTPGIQNSPKYKAPFA